METIDIDLLTVFVAAVAYKIISFFWYSKTLFGKKPVVFPAKLSTVTGQLISFLIAFIIACFLAILEALLGVTSTMDGIYLGLGVCFGFVATSKCYSVLWQKLSFRTYLIDMGFLFIGFAVMGGIIAA